MKTCSCCSAKSMAKSRKLKKGLWSPDEDDKLRRFVTKHGIMKWSQVPILAGLERCGKSCRLRWLNYLRPGIKRGKLTPQEQKLVFELQSLHGNRWSWIAQRMPGRTDNEIKNFWNVVHKSRKTTNVGHISSYRRVAPFGIEIYEPNLEHEAKSQGLVNMQHGNVLMTQYCNASCSSPSIGSKVDNNYDLASEFLFDASIQEFMDWDHFLQPDSLPYPD